MRWLWLSLLILLAGCSGGAKRQGALETSYWYWHTPYTLSPDDLAGLKKLGVRQLFGRAGTFTKDGERLLPSVPQKFEAPDFPIHLVYNFDAGAIAHLGEFRAADMAKVIAEQFEKDRAACGQAHIEVRGIQLDIDCPTRVLPVYAALLREVRAQLPKKTALSITALPTWFGSDDLRQVVEEVDFYAPQFYEGSAAETVNDKRTISDIEGMRKGLREAAKLGRPFYVGVPGYGRALLYDEKGRLLGGYRTLSLDDAARHPSFELAEHEDIGDEGYYRFRAVKPGKDGRGLGYSLVYRVPTPTLVAKHLEIVRREAPSNCLGAIVFRVPEERESMAVPLRSVVAAVEGKDLRPKLRFGTRREADPWQRIENPKVKEDASQVWISLENVGDGGTPVGPEALTVRIEFEPGTVREFNRGGFDGAQVFRRLEDGREMRSSLASANTLVLRRVHLAAGEKTMIGPLTLSSKGKLNCSYDLVAESNGERVKGTQRISVNEKG